MVFMFLRHKHALLDPAQLFLNHRNFIFEKIFGVYKLRAGRYLRLGLRLIEERFVCGCGNLNLKLGRCLIFDLIISFTRWWYGKFKISIIELIHECVDFSITWKLLWRNSLDLMHNALAEFVVKSRRLLDTTSSWWFTRQNLKLELILEWKVHFCLHDSLTFSNVRLVKA